ncbi:MAG: amidohydrolase, partial [Deltaproteobacteria bacterium]
NVESLKLLFRICGPERCLFGTERPGAGSKTDPRTGKWYDDVRPNIESIPWLNAEDKEKIFHANAAQVFTRFKQ